MPDTPYPYLRDIASTNTRCEIAEGVAFDQRLSHLPDSDQQVVNDLIHEYLEWAFGPETIKD